MERTHTPGVYRGLSTALQTNDCSCKSLLLQEEVKDDSKRDMVHPKTFSAHTHTHTHTQESTWCSCWWHHTLAAQRCEVGQMIVCHACHAWKKIKRGADGTDWKLPTTSHTGSSVCVFFMISECNLPKDPINLLYAYDSFTEGTQKNKEIVLNFNSIYWNNYRGDLTQT